MRGYTASAVDRRNIAVVDTERLQTRWLID